MKKIKVMTLCLLASTAFIAPAYANNPYVLGQVGATNQNDWKKYGLTGRFAAGYEWDTALQFGKCNTEPHYVNFNYGFELGYQFYQKENFSNSNTANRYSFETDSFYPIAKTTLYRHTSRQSIDLLAVLDIAPIPCVDFFIKFGPALVMQKVDKSSTLTDEIARSTTTLYTTRTRDARLVPKIILGVGYDITDSINLNVAYTHEFQTSQLKTVIKDTSESLTKDQIYQIPIVQSVSSIMFGVKYRFC